jgi:hypothetical protein
MSCKEIEVTFEEIPEDKEVLDESKNVQKEALYRVMIALKPRIATVTQLVVPYEFPFVNATIMCEDSKARCYISEVRGRVIRIKSRISKSAKECAGTLFIRVTDGTHAKRSPN